MYKVEMKTQFLPVNEECTSGEAMLLNRFIKRRDDLPIEVQLKQG